jgi:hypothetical protein
MEAELQLAFQLAFGVAVRLDYSGMQQLVLRVAKNFGGALPTDPRKLYEVMTKFAYLDKQGDGFRSFVGVVLSVLLSKGRIVLLDEPEAFLHPAQARQLGLWIAEQTAKMSSQILIATHNANFLAGILASGTSVDIFRMSRKDDVTSYDRISSCATKRLSTSPILSSQRVLEAIFHRGVVICEGDADRSVYQTVAVRDLDNSEVLFINAHNKQTIPLVAELLRGAKIPFCSVTDLDALNSDDEFAKLIASVSPAELEAAQLKKWRDEIAKQVVGLDDKSVLADLSIKVQEFCEQLRGGEHSLPGARSALNRLRGEATEWHQIKQKGVDGFPEAVRLSAESIISGCARRGLFLVPVGEVEGWMDLGTKRKKDWIVLALAALHARPAPSALQSFVGCMLRFLGAAQTSPATLAPLISPPQGDAVN